MPWGSMRERRQRGLILSAAALVLGALLAGAASDAGANQAAINSGQAWLSANISADNTWHSSRDPRGVRSTSRALLALGDAAPVATRQWLETQLPFNLEETQEAGLALGIALPEAFLAPLAGQKSAIGKWASSPGATPAAYHTALALVTLAQSGRQASADVLPGAAYLRSLQFLDGSWPTGENLEIDLLGTVYSAFFFLPMLKRNSRILMISSGFGLIGAAGYSVYCAAKAGIVNFAESLPPEGPRREQQGLALLSHLEQSDC